MPFPRPDLSLCIPLLSEHAWEMQLTGLCFLAMYLPFCIYKSDSLRRAAPRLFKMWQVSALRSAHLRGAAPLASFLLILLKPLGLLIRNNSALMFGPLACEVYLWAVWEGTHAYLYTHAQVFSKTRVSTFHFSFSNTHTHTHTHGRTQPQAQKRCRDAGAFITGSQQK